MTNLHAVRHGETTWGREGRILGSSPGVLTNRGFASAEALVDHIRELAPDVVYTSDLNRALQTIEPTRRASSVSNYFETDLLRERDFGELEGKLFSEVAWDEFWQLPTDSNKYGSESLDHFTQRVARFVLQCVEGQHGVVLAVTHIGVMNRLRYLEDPNDFEFIPYPNARIVEFATEKIIKNAKKLVTS